jgi:hypothetical protein
MPPIQMAKIYETVIALAIFHQLERETVEGQTVGPGATTPDITWDMPRDVPCAPRKAGEHRPAGDVRTPDTVNG